MNYPIFKNPRQYLAFRKGGFLAAPFKKWAEWRCLDRCIKNLDSIDTICDCPCGPGRLFPYWKKRGFKVIGVDLSEEMLQAAHDCKNDLNVPGVVFKADAFRLHRALKEKPDLVASIRFLYYFDRPKRVRLLRSLARVSGRYLLLQYKTPTTLKGRLSFAKSLRSTHPKNFCSSKGIVEEIKEAGLVPLRVIVKGDSSDRVFVLAQKPDTTVTLNYHSRIYYPRTLRNFALAAAGILIFFGFMSYYTGLLGDIHEKQVGQVVKKYQDGNDHFYVADDSHLEDLRTNKHLTIMNDFDQADDLARIDQTEAEDSFFLVKEKDLWRISRTNFWKQLSLVKRVNIGAENFVLLSTEKKVALPAVRRGTSYLILPYKNASCA